MTHRITRKLCLKVFLFSEADYLPHFVKRDVLHQEIFTSAA